MSVVPRWVLLVAEGAVVSCCVSTVVCCWVMLCVVLTVPNWSRLLMA